MNSINLLPKEVQQGRAFTSLQRTVYVITSVILSAYVVITAALFGWWIYLSQTSTAVSADMQEATVEIQKLASVEQLVLQLQQRAGSSQSFLNSRLTIADPAERILSNSLVNVTEWLYLAGGEQTISVASGRADAIEAYADGLSKEYTTEISSLEKIGSQWTAQITLLPLVNVSPAPTP